MLREPVSDAANYNNIAVGIMQGNNGNAVYCPTNSQALVRLQDQFTYLPEKPEKKLDMTKMERRILSETEFQSVTKTKETPATYLLSAAVEDVGAEGTMAFRVNGLTGTKETYTGYYMKKDNTLEKMKNFMICHSLYNTAVFHHRYGRELADAQSAGNSVRLININLGYGQPRRNFSLQPFNICKKFTGVRIDGAEQIDQG